jgi:excisionase family DNA binding protein
MLKTIHETSELLRVSVCTIRRLIWTQKIPCHRIGRKIFFTDEDIQTAIGAFAVPAGIGEGEAV